MGDNDMGFHVKDGFFSVTTSVGRSRSGWYSWSGRNCSRRVTVGLEIIHFIEEAAINSKKKKK